VKVQGLSDARLSSQWERVRAFHVSPSPDLPFVYLGKLGEAVLGKAVVVQKGAKIFRCHGTLPATWAFEQLSRLFFVDVRRQ
jgi:hypothetical protein